MAEQIDSDQLRIIQSYDAEKRLKYLLREVTANRELWILTDQHGCVMLNSEDEDCVPVWPNQEFAESWATGDWQSCTAEAIPVNKWRSRWTPGLADDELAIAVFPNDLEEGLILYPDEFDFELEKASRR